MAHNAHRGASPEAAAEQPWDSREPEPLAEIRNYTDLLVWQGARALVRRVYELSERFPKAERFGLTQQLRRAAVSVPSNIAEGYGRGSLRDYIRFLQMARGSLYEMQTQLVLAEDLAFVAGEEVQALRDEASNGARLLHGLLRSLRKSESV
ncbi:MAG: four helix bundle protein [Phycisphaerae bacterium]